ncbi:MAG: Gfo/Idh/MocA family protein [Kiritimatiellia bacterium]
MSKTRAVLVGCGGISNAWLGTATVKKQVNVAGLVDLSLDAAKAKQERHGLKNAVIGSDLAAVLKDVQPDVVFDCTIPEAHCAVTLTALKHGCHVMGEKPMSDSMPSARRMAAAAAKAGKVYAVMQNRRYLSGIRAVRKFIDSGAIGPLVAVHSDFFIGAHFGGFRDVMEHVLLLDMAIHSFDQARFLTRSDAEYVYAHEWTPKHSWYKSGPSASAIFEMQDGLVYTYQGSWCAEGCPTAWECSWRFIGEKGTLIWNGGDSLRCEVVKGKTGFIREIQPKIVPMRCPKYLAGGHNSAIAAFLKAVREGAEPETHCKDNIKSLAMVHASVQSATSGKRVPVKI